jgi:hypothetical protein
MRFAAVVVVVMVGCRPEPKSCTTWRSTPGACTRTAIDETVVDDPSMIRVRFAYVWHGEPTTKMPFEWIIPKSRLHAVRDSAHDQVTCERMTSGPGCRIWLLPEKAARDAPPPPPLAAREAVCPPGGRSDSPVPIDATVLASALGPSTDEWQRTDVAEANVAGALYTRGVQQVRVTVRDMIRACTGVAGSGELLLETEGDAEAIRRRVLSATSAVLLRWPGPPVERAQVVMWVADRCQIVVESTAPHHVSPKVGVSVEDLIAVGRAVDVARLQTICSAR